MSNKSTGRSNNDLPSSLEAVIIKNIKEERLRESRKRYFRLAELIANSVHEIGAQLSLISSFILLLQPSDQKRIARVLKMDINLCKQLDAYTKSMENLPKDLRDMALEGIKCDLMKPIIDKCTESIRIKI